MAIKLSTAVSVVKAPFEVSHAQHVMMVGSCFTDAIGLRLQQGGFDVLRNPFGTLYNPLSIADSLRRIDTCQEVLEDDLVQCDGLWHSWYHHTRFSNSDKRQCIDVCNDALREAYAFWQQCDTVVLTLGTAYAYFLVDSQRVVANCHKLPAACFLRQLLSVDSCVEALRSLPLKGRKLVLTVSPIRHLADTAHGNQISKATLLLAVNEYLQSSESSVTYFPAYEIMQDELRDYRFYDRDMLHPNDVAVDIIYERFQDMFCDDSTRRLLLENEKRWRHSQHRPITNQ
ncbi:MAG: GSCFA domain-containing protein [Bacteroidales bacterium]|nr:GSCFA domain-containing protein [Candidatus Colimorpha onthohippi]